jgi:hypothetical protein
MKMFLSLLALIFPLAFLPYRSYAADVDPIFTTLLVGISVWAMAGYSQHCSHHTLGIIIFSNTHNEKYVLLCEL